MVRRGQSVGVLMGGLSSERKVSIQSGRAVARALREKGWYVVEIDVDRDLPAKLLKERVDVAYLALHGRFGEDGCVQGLLEVMGIPYTGCGVRASAVAMDKLATKRAVAHLEEVTMAADHVYRAGDDHPEHLQLPVVCKPLVGGSTIGISVCRTREELEKGLADALQLHDVVLLEQFVQGEEITVAVLEGEALPVVRILPDSGFFDFDAKYTKGRTRYECPAQIDEGTALMAQLAAQRVYEALDCRGLCRADFLVREDGVPVFLEINTIPGMTETSLSPMAAKAKGIDFPDLVEQVLLAATCMEPEVDPWQDPV